MQHLEFFDTDHFENNYHRVAPHPSLSHLIDFFWETRFDELWPLYPNGFSDALFPNTGYTYLVNLGTPFIMQVGETKTVMRTDGFLPRHSSIECHHQPGNKIFGIKFRISPVLFRKKINFSEYRSSIFPLSYLLEKDVLQRVKEAAGFDERVKMLNEYFVSLLDNAEPASMAIGIVSEILDNCSKEKKFDVSIKELSAHYGISARTLQRYFEITTSLSSKKTLQILRVRKAVEQFAKDPSTFDFREFGYYDHSHFYKHLKQFLQKQTLHHLKPHLDLLSKRKKTS